MTEEELVKKLEPLGITATQYSLTGEYLPDRFVLENYQNEWEVCYFDEKGNKNESRMFNNEEDALNYIYKRFLDLYRLRRGY